MKRQPILLIFGNDADILHSVKRLPHEIYSFALEWDAFSVKSENIYLAMEKAEREGIQTTPKTAHPSVQSFVQLFNKSLERYEQILAFSISSKLSGCFNAMKGAAKLLPEDGQKRLFIIDTKGGAPSTALLLEHTAKLVQKDSQVKTIYEAVLNMISGIHTFGMVKNPYWLESGGRISPAVAIILKQMAKINIRPLLGLKEDGSIGLLQVKMRAGDTADVLFEHLKNDVDQNNTAGKPVTIVIDHANNPDTALAIQRKIETANVGKVLSINVLSPIIGAHLGPGTVFMSWAAF